MTMRDSRGARLLVAAALAWLGLAFCAQAAHATYGKIQVVKINQGGNAADTFSFHPELVPTTSDFALKGGETSATFSVECNIDRPGKGTECARWSYPALKVSELPKPGYTLTDITCRFTQGSSGYAGEPTTSSATKPASEVTKNLANGSVSLKVHWYEQVKCWFTNTRDSGTIKVTKKVVAPAGDTGKFNLLIGGTAFASNVGDGGTTGTIAKAAGSYTVGETAGTGTSLTDYSASTACVDKAHAGQVDNDGTVQVDAGDQWECTITNTRKTGTIEVTKKVVAPLGDTGRFNLLIDGKVSKVDAKDGDSTGDVVVPTGSHDVGETAGLGTDLGPYGASIACTDTAAGHTGKHSSSGAALNGIVVGSGDAWKCIITNTRSVTPTPPTQQQSAPQIEVSPVKIKAGSATLSGPRSCPRTKVVAATVTGKRIVKVTFFIEGKPVKTLTKANGKNGSWTLSIKVSRLGYGTHSVKVQVEFAASSTTKTKTLRMSFSRCRQHGVTPKFTG
jgi:prealbumin domain-containing protein